MFAKDFGKKSIVIQKSRVGDAFRELCAVIAARKLFDLLGVSKLRERCRLKNLHMQNVNENEFISCHTATKI